MARKQDEQDRKRREKLSRASLKRIRALSADLDKESAANVRGIPEDEWAQAELEDEGAVEESGKRGKAESDGRTAEELKEARDWHALFQSEDFSNVQRLVHLAARWDAVDETQWHGELLRTAHKAYDDELTIQAARAGCPNKRGHLRNGAIILEMNETAGADATSVVRTYNYDLAIAVKHIRSEAPKANRYVYAKRIADWAAARASWKDPQINQMTTGKARSLAQQHFSVQNATQGEATLAPRQCSCPICCGWVARGTVPLKVAMNNPANWHPNCPHYWVITYAGSYSCEDLWTGE